MALPRGVALLWGRARAHTSSRLPRRTPEDAGRHVIVHQPARAAGLPLQRAPPALAGQLAQRGLVQMRQRQQDAAQQHWPARRLLRLRHCRHVIWRGRVQAASLAAAVLLQRQHV